MQTDLMPYCRQTSADISEVLRGLATDHSHISVRLQLNGTLWTDHFYSVLVFSDHAIILTHMPTRSVLHVRDEQTITGFEIDIPYKGLACFQRYSVDHNVRKLKLQTDGSLHAQQSI